MTLETLQEAWIKRADEVLRDFSGLDFGEAIQCATSGITAFYGPESAQMKTFRSLMDSIGREKSGQEHRLQMLAYGTIRNIRAEISAGLTKKVRVIVTGEILGDLIASAKEILADPQDPEVAKNIGAVLVAAAFEDLLRRLGADFAGITDRRTLQEVISALKQAGVLKGGEPGTAQSYLKFRNDSFHADWSNVQRPQVDSCLAFVESLVIRHLS